MAIPGLERLAWGLVKSAGRHDQPTLRRESGLLKAADANSRDPLWPRLGWTAGRGVGLGLPEGDGVSPSAR